MSAFFPVIAILLALVAAASIVYLAWELTSEEVQESLEKSLGRPEAPPGDDETEGKSSDSS